MFRQSVLPRWRGFNFDGRHRDAGRFREEDFRIVAELGFDFVRLPLCYWDWADRKDPSRVDESRLAFVDEAVEWGERWGVHVDLNFHRAPGFCVGDIELEPYRLFRDADADACFLEHWRIFARRYRGRSPRWLGFNLLNEPRWVVPALHGRLMRSAVAAIREIDGDRPIVLDGLNTGNEFPTDLVDLGAAGVSFSCRGYAPLGVTHFEADWGNHAIYETARPCWPGAASRVSSTGHSDGTWDRVRLEKRYDVWAAIAEATGTGVVCGECGCFNRTPHAIALAWMEDLLDVLTERNIGYAFWNLRGPFGILDSGRTDVAYEEWRGHLLDRAMLDVLRAH